MTKTELMALIVESMREYVAEQPPVKPQTLKENTMKKTELKTLVKEVVRQCVKEAGPQYKVRTNKSAVEQPGNVNRARDIQCDPTINELAPFAAEDEPPINGDEHAQYDEQEEIRLLKQIAQCLLKLLKMHKGMEEPETSGPESPADADEPAETSDPEPPSVPDEKDDSEEEKLQETNYKVQSRSQMTIKDAPQNPKNVRDPKIPQS